MLACRKLIWARRLAAGCLLGGALAAPGLERLEPANGCYLGFNVGQGDTIQRLSARLGLAPAVFVQFYAFPLSSEGWTNLNAFFSEVRDGGGLALVTLEPFGGLTNVTTNACLDLANFCAAFETQGIAGIILRFAHEMNGNWYPWGQQPILYTNTFRLLAQTVHGRTTRTALLWAPNYGAGYPFPFGGPYRPAPGSPDFLALDTDGDGALTEADDMYGPYYPGDDAVDWVGMTLYHWGTNYPWLENELPRPNSFALALTGNNGQLPDFYARFCADAVHRKPLAIPETSAFFNTQQPGANEFAIKQAWWQQVFNLAGDNAHGWDVALHFPKLKCVNWFDHYKPEAEAQNQWIDWRISACPVLRDAFLDQVRTNRGGQPYFLTAPEAQRELAPYAIVPRQLPQVLPLSGTLAVAFQTKTPTNCDLVIDLLDETFQWHGGTRVPVAAGLSNYAAQFALTQPLTDGALYRWSVFLTPTGSNYLSALAWYRGPRPVARAVTAAVEIVAAPPAWLPGSNLTARLKYTTPTNAVLHLGLLDAAGTWRTGRTLTVTRPDSALDLTLASRAGLADGAYFLEALLSNSPTNRQTPFARSARRALMLASAPPSAAVDLVVEPPAVLAGDVFRFMAGYLTPSNAELRVELWATNGAAPLASLVEPVTAGSDLRCLSLTFTQPAVGSYLARAVLGPAGQSNAPPWASTPWRPLDVYATDYRDWVEAHWGLAFGTDPVAPAQDADRDGASNRHEFLALTDPRDPAALLRVSATLTNGQLLLRWPSVLGRSYQVWRNLNLASNTWTRVSSTYAGTGQPLQFNAGTAVGVPKFYRVWAFPP